MTWVFTYVKYTCDHMLENMLEQSVCLVRLWWRTPEKANDGLQQPCYEELDHSLPTLRKHATITAHHFLCE
jgi:hypothetical protein